MTTPYYQDDRVTVHHGDCLDVLRTLPDCSVDSAVTDPPYGLEFMGKGWDSFKSEAGRNYGGFHGGGISATANAPAYNPSPNPTCRNCGGLKFLASEGSGGRTKCRCERPDYPNYLLPKMRAYQEWCEAWTAECLRVLKPGGHMLAFGGTRTWHRLACAIEDAGFEIRDTVASLGGGDSAGLLWMHGQGFPKSLDVSKAIDKAAGAEREVVGVESALGPERPISDAWTKGVKVPDGSPMVGGNPGGRLREVTAPATEDAARWEGYGTALKPAFEPIVVARKPLAGTVAANVTTWGTGALNIAATRVGAAERPVMVRTGTKIAASSTENPTTGATSSGEMTTLGRWPSNVVLTHAADCEHEDDGGCDEGCPVAELDAQSGTLTSGANPTRRGSDKFREAYGDFKGQEECTPARGADAGGASRFFPTFRYEAKADATERPRASDTAHPTVKPLALMRWLVRLVTPPGGLVLDPFAGSGTTAEACIVEGFRCVTIEREAEYLPLIVHRITRRTNPVANLTAQAERGEDVDLGLFGLLDDLGGVA